MRVCVYVCVYTCVCVCEKKNLFVWSCSLLYSFLERTRVNAVSRMLLTTIHVPHKCYGRDGRADAGCHVYNESCSSWFHQLDEEEKKKKIVFSLVPPELDEEEKKKKMMMNCFHC